MRWGLLFKAIGMVVGPLLAVVAAIAALTLLSAVIPSDVFVILIVAVAVVVFVSAVITGVYHMLVDDDERERMRKLPGSEIVK